ncbi:hypothetical protein [Aromatoleum toluclasticum]|uniref:hypothetical protein n=1 Tax=Aromatoleum toluclasticum TaxID=92003 RepID=UPI00038148EE|nr:hypothetical protein [Aromatoleum toluclasticum]
MLTATILWGGMFPVAKDALRVVDTFYLNTLRYVVTAAAFILVLYLVLLASIVAVLAWNAGIPRTS